MAVQIVGFPGPEKDTIPFPWERKFPCKVELTIKWPPWVTHEGRDYFPTEREGTRLTDNCPSAEYKCEDRMGEDCLWLYLDGSILKG